MKNDDRNAVIALILLLFLIQRSQTGGFKFAFDSGLSTDDLKGGGTQAAVGAVTYTALRMLGGTALRFIGITTPVGALIAAASVALFAYPWIKRKLTGENDGQQPLPCNIDAQSICGGSGVARWREETHEGRRYLSVMCNNGQITTLQLLETCK